MSHATTRADGARQETCAKTPDLCPVCLREGGSAAHGRCCTRNCEEGAYRSFTPSREAGLSACGAIAPGGCCSCTLNFGHGGHHVAEVNGAIGHVWTSQPRRGAA